MGASPKGDRPSRTETRAAEYGISVNFNQVKVPAGLLWNFPLHIQNNTNKPVIVYLFICIAQLMIFPYAYGKRYKKDGDYHNIDFLSHLGINQTERDAVRNTLNKWKPIQYNYEFQMNRENITKNIEEFEKKKKPFLRLRRTIINSNFMYDFLTANIYLAVPGAILYKEFGVPILVIIGLGCVASVLHTFRQMKKLF